MGSFAVVCQSPFAEFMDDRVDGFHKGVCTELRNVSRLVLVSSRNVVRLTALYNNFWSILVFIGGFDICWNSYLQLHFFCVNGGCFC